MDKTKFSPHIFGQAKAAFRPSCFAATPSLSSLSRPVLKLTKSRRLKNLNLAHIFCCHFHHSCPTEFLKAYSDSLLQGGFTSVFGCFLVLS